MRTMISRIRDDESGIALEYILIAAVVGIGILAALTIFRNELISTLDYMAAQVRGAR